MTLNYLILDAVNDPLRDTLLPTDNTRSCSLSALNTHHSALCLLLFHFAPSLPRVEHFPFSLQSAPAFSADSQKSIFPKGWLSIISPQSKSVGAGGAPAGSGRCNSKAGQDFKLKTPPAYTPLSGHYNSTTTSYYSENTPSSTWIPCLCATVLINSLHPSAWCQFCCFKCFPKFGSWRIYEFISRKWHVTGKSSHSRCPT